MAYSSASVINRILAVGLTAIGLTIYSLCWCFIYFVTLFDLSLLFDAASEVFLVSLLESVALLVLLGSSLEVPNFSSSVSSVFFFFLLLLS